MYILYIYFCSLILFWDIELPQEIKNCILIFFKYKDVFCYYLNLENN